MTQAQQRAAWPGSQVKQTHPQPGRWGRGVVMVTAMGGLVALTVAEVRRLLARLVWHPPSDPAFTLAWSIWRRRHQATARRIHYQQQRRKLQL